MNLGPKRVVNIRIRTGSGFTKFSTFQSRMLKPARLFMRFWKKSLQVMFRKATYLAFTLFVGLTLLTSCQYELTKDYFRDIKPPSETPNVVLNLKPVADTILIAGRMPVEYDFSTDSLTVWSIKFEIGGETIYEGLKDLTGTIYIDGSQFEPGVYKLKATILTHSGTNSIADCIGAEGYVATMEWTVMLDNPTWQTAPKPFFSKTTEGFLKINWTKCPIYTFDSYVVNLPSNHRDTIRDRNCTSIVDSMYIPGGMRMADLKFNYLYQGYWTYSNLSSTTIFEERPALQIQRVSADSIRVFWKRPTYQVRYSLVAENHYLYGPTTNLLHHDTDSSVVVAQIGSSYITYKLTVRSYTTTRGRTPLSVDCNTMTYQNAIEKRVLVSNRWVNRP